jgi:hypothetical protein
MGYPMTFRRFVNRNGLADGDYGAAPQRHEKRVITNVTEGTLMTDQETLLARGPSWARRVDEYEAAARMLAGDLRRLELDAVDEGAICKLIAHRTGIDTNVVAAVLKEFVSE